VSADQPPFQSYEQLFREAGTVLAFLHTCEMPPRGSPLASDERATLIAWLACGAPNN